MNLPPRFPDRFNLADYFLFERLREGLAEKMALRFGPRAYTYDEVARRTRAFAAALEEADVRRGERVAIVLPDVPAFAWTFFGTLARGCVVAMGNPDSPIEAIEYLVEYTRATAIVTVPRVAAALRDRMRAGVVGREVRRVWGVAEVSALEADAPDPDSVCEIGDGMFRCLARELGSIDPMRAPTLTHRDEPAVWLFTSGSTGEPKANIHSHRDFAYNTEVYAKRTVGYRTSRRDRERAASLFRIRDRDEPHVPLRGRRDRRSLQRATDVRGGRARPRAVPAHRS